MAKLHDDEKNVRIIAIQEKLNARMNESAKLRDKTIAAQDVIIASLNNQQEISRQLVDAQNRLIAAYQVEGNPDITGPFKQQLQQLSQMLAATQAELKRERLVVEKLDSEIQQQRTAIHNLQDKIDEYKEKERVRKFEAKRK